MRFYDPATTPPERLDSLELFPHLSEEEGAIKCLRMGLLPSVTNILGTFREEYLERHMIREGIKHFEKHRNVDFALDAVYGSSPNSDFGTDCHDIVELKLLGKPIPKDGTINPVALKHCKPLLAWIDKNVKEVIHAEVVLASQTLGTAGTVDMVIVTHANQYVVGDLKVVKFSDKYPPKPGLAYRCQLSAYAEMLRETYDKTFQRWSFYLASPFGWNNRPDIRVFRHKESHLETFKAAKLIWENKLLMERVKGELA